MVGVHRDRATCLAWTPDSRFVVSGSHDTSVRVWRSALDTAELQAFARTRVFRSLTAEEREAHMLAVPGEGQ